MGVRIERGTRIGNQNAIGEHAQVNIVNEKKNNFFSKHPILMTLIISLVVGLILMFSFWKDVISFIEKIFK